jgi:uncharacterized protein YjbI with pentapeptide repeats
MVAPPLKRLPVEGIKRILDAHAAYRTGRTGGRRASFEHCHLSGFSFAGRDLTDADFTGARLDKADFSRCTLHSASFFGADMRQAAFVNADLRRADLRGSLVHGANLTGANLAEADLREGVVMRQDGSGELRAQVHSALPVNAGDASFRYATLNRAKMGGAIAMAADFSFATMRGVNLSRAHLKQAKLVGADLTGADLTGANLEGADLRDCILLGAKTAMMRTRGADMSGAMTEPPRLEASEEQRIAAMMEDHLLWRESMGDRGKPGIFDGLDLRGARNLTGRPLTALRARSAILFGLDLTGCELQGASLTGADLRAVKMPRADLRGASLAGAKGQRLVLAGANLTPLVLPNGRALPCDLSGADLSWADLTGADLRAAVLDGTNLDGAKLDGARFDPAVAAQLGASRSYAAG